MENKVEEVVNNFFTGYKLTEPFLDEVFVNEGLARPAYQRILDHYQGLSTDNLISLIDYTKVSFFNQGITFNVYSDKAQNTERIFPFDIFPRIITSEEWEMIEEGVKQRITAINHFLHDLYNDKNILKDKIVPAELIFNNASLCKYMAGFTPPGKVYTHISGVDLIKHSDGKFYILEDNVRCPSGVSYVLSNRISMKRTFAELFEDYQVEPVAQYPERLLETMQSVAPSGVDDPTCVLLSPGMYNSAYYEHTYLAGQMGIELVEGNDLFVDNNFVYMKTIEGPEKVDVIYRRIDDDFIDPMAFNPDSLLGVPGIMAAYRSGNVTLVNAPGTGIADDKAVYIYMPEIIKYYLDEEPILNNVKTYRCEKPDEYKYVMDNLEDLVVKPVDESGGYGIVIGHKATKSEIEECRKRIKNNRRKYIAQPVMNLSVHSTFIEERSKFEQRHIDLRVYALCGKDDIYVCKGGLTRVALTKGKLVVNSSQGGGSKDTWVLKN